MAASVMCCILSPSKLDYLDYVYVYGNLAELTAAVVVNGEVNAAVLKDFSISILEFFFSICRVVNH